MGLFGRKRTLANEGVRCAACVTRPPSTFDLQALATSRQDTVVVGLECGECGLGWDDAVAPTGVRSARCPFCGALNDIGPQWYVVVVE